jgi:hypothetical protein
MSAAVPLTQAVTSGDANAVKAALASGADVNERNNGGQTALILAVIFGHTNLVRLLVNAGADPRLRDNLGLDAVEWAHRRGLPLDLFEIRRIRVEETTSDTDEKSRKWLAGVKQRIEEQSTAKEEPAPVIPPEPEPIPIPVPVPVPVPVNAATTSPTQKRCPKCNAIYNSELIAYCAHHFVRLVDVDEPVFEPPQSVTSTITNTPLLWMLVLATVSIAAFTGYLVTSQLSQVVLPDSAATAPQPLGFVKGTPAAAGDLAGKALTLAEAECPIYEKLAGSNTNAGPETVNVHVKLDKNGKVFWARAEGGNEAMRNAATDAATQSSFSPDKLRGRETEGTITYTFTP